MSPEGLPQLLLAQLAVELIALVEPPPVAGHRPTGGHSL